MHHRRRRAGVLLRAITELTEAIRLDPNSSLAYNCRGVADDRKRNFNKAISDFTEVIRARPKLCPYLSESWIRLLQSW